MRTCAIVNPVADGGRVRRIWPQLLSRLMEATSGLSVRWTTGPNTATPLTQEALRHGFDRIVAVGGDGTLHEVVNGFFEDEVPIRPSAVLTHIPCGSGADFRRTLNIPKGVDSVYQLCSDRIRALDLLRVRYRTPMGHSAHGYCINIVSFGLSSVVAQTVSQGLPIPPSFRYLGAALAALTSHRPVPVRITIDGQPLDLTRVHLVAVANGHTFGAGVRIAPAAVPDDGQFDVTVLRDVSPLSLLRHLPHFYRGTHTSLEGVTTYRGRTLTVEPCESEPVWLDTDGELQGLLPASFEIVPKALRVQY